MKAVIPTHKTETPAKSEKPVVLDLRFRDPTKDPTAPVAIRHGITTMAALARLGNHDWKKVQQFKFVTNVASSETPGTTVRRTDQIHIISKPNSGVVLLMESEAIGTASITVKKITMYAALDYQLYKKLNVALPNGNERVVEPRLYADLPRPKQVMLIETNVTNIVEKVLKALDFHKTPGREAHGLFLNNWCGKRWNDMMFIPEAVARPKAEVFARKSNNPNYSIERSMAQQSEEIERSLPAWFQQMVCTDEFHAFRSMRIKNPARAERPAAKQLKELANKFSHKTEPRRDSRTKKEHRPK